MIGKIKGYSVCNASKNMLKKDELFEDILTRDKKIKEKIQNILSDNGMIYGLKKDKKIKAVYLFESTFEDKKHILKFTEKIILDEINKEIQEKFEECIISELSEFVSLEEYSKIEWGDNIIVPKKVKIGKYSIALGSFMVIIGTIFGFLINDLVLGVCIGTILGYSIGAIVEEKNADIKIKLKK